MMPIDNLNCRYACASCRCLDAVCCLLMDVDINTTEDTPNIPIPHYKQMFYERVNYSMMASWRV